MSELRTDSLSFIEAIGQSIANVSPTLTPANRGRRGGGDGRNCFLAVVLAGGAGDHRAGGRRL